MEGFTVSLALVDAIPVMLFGASMLLTAQRFHSPLFLLGAVLSVLAGCMKVSWKLILGIWKKDIAILNRPFVPIQAAGFLMMLVSFVLGWRSISWRGLWAAVTGFPSVVFFALWVALMGTMVWYRKTRFQRNNARTNWTAQIINGIAQAALFLGILVV